MTSPDDATDQPEVNDTRQRPRRSPKLRTCREGAVGGTPVSATDEPGADDEVLAEVEVDVESDGAETDGAEADRCAETDVFGDAAPAPVFAQIDRPIQTVGRRKEAIVRVRLVSGTGRIVCNGKAFEEYFPNKVHQQLIREPLVMTERTEQFDVFATPARWRHVRPGRRPAPRPRPRPHRGRPGRPSGPQEGRLPHPRPAGHGAQEVRPQEGPEGSSVLEALMARLFGTDGVRGLANADLSPELATAVSASAAGVLAEHARAGGRRGAAGSRPLAVVGRDPRASGEMLEAAVTAGLSAAGADVLRVGVLPTPGVAYLTGEFDADLGVMISASHNPMPDNGIKLFAAGGHKLPDALEDEIEAHVRAGDATPRPTGHDIGRVRDVPDALERYVAHLASATPTPLAGCTSSSTARTAPPRRPRPAPTPRPAPG